MLLRNLVFFRMKFHDRKYKQNVMVQIVSPSSFFFLDINTLLAPATAKQLQLFMVKSQSRLDKCLTLKMA
jgi:hypothetical protein